VCVYVCVCVCVCVCVLGWDQPCREAFRSRLGEGEGMESRVLVNTN
jgi:hypothetical protein